MSDIHSSLRDTQKSITLISNAISKTDPDLIVLNGDQVAVKLPGGHFERSVNKFLEVIDSSNVPFALTFGNHDPEISYPISQQLSYYQKYPRCLAISGPEEITGIGNYNLLIKDSKQEHNIFNLWFVDSGPDSSSFFTAPDQVSWYTSKSRELNSQNNGRPLPSLWFQHRPIPEVYQTMLINSDFPHTTTAISKGNYFGSFLSLNPELKYDPTGLFFEGPDVAFGSEYENGLYEAWLNNGDVIAAFFGHNHGDSFFGYTKDGIGIGFDSSAGFVGSYEFPGMDRGCRVIDIDERDTNHIDTRMLYYGEIVEDAEIGFLTKVGTYGGFNSALAFLRKCLFPSCLQKKLGNKLMVFLKTKFGPSN
ncbi:Calcineurin-like phosphoesterase [Histomonas meleagridis]|uniref:Calcineurin-like phosphoesterase n=1 Tax=Histomonas meleagridis TaxID=135588 RepID=UPI00355AB1A9|nr:Calcineurin-like phosphoesterase [Histomonas meleagridis]KAH0805694.1 Calcineurin-like phosphoesterase [Histomonas meleagridis]